jgi:TatD DNase family protein
MLTDAHCHPFDLLQVFPQEEEERRRMGIIAAASACEPEEFAYNEDKGGLSAGRSVGLLPCFAVHPQFPALKPAGINRSLETMHNLAAEGRLAAVGECGFDLYNAAFRETEAVQDRLFAAHIETALRYDLPVVIHARRAMHKVFAAAKTIAKCRAVIFHSWPGSLEEGEALLRRGVNAYFSFGCVIMLNHLKAMRCYARLPAERLLTETDAPFQPPKDKSFSQWADLPRILEAASALRSDSTDVKELEMRIEANFRSAFNQKKYDT